MAVVAAVSPAEMVEIDDRIIAVQLVLAGGFKTEIEAIKAERAALADDVAALGSKKTIAKNLAESEKTLADAKAEAEKVATAAEEMRRAADELMAAASNAQRAANAKDAENTQWEARCAAKQMALDERERKLESNWNLKNDALTTRQRAVEEGEASLKSAQAELHDEKLAFNKRLEALRA